MTSSPTPLLSLPLGFDVLCCSIITLNRLQGRGSSSTILDSMAITRVERRQSEMWDDDHYYSSTVVNIKWAILVIMIVLVWVYFIGGYIHGHRRWKQGKAPLAYHRWFLPRRQYASYELDAHRQQQFSFYRQAQPNGYDIHPMPPPAYNPNMPPPPSYQPPAGASKIDPSQHTHLMPQPARGSASTILDRDLPDLGPQATAVPAPIHTSTTTNPFR